MAEVNHRCSICGEGFKTVQGLRGHERLKHENSAVAVGALNKGGTTTPRALSPRNTEHSNRVLNSSAQIPSTQKGDTQKGHEASAQKGDEDNGGGISLAGRLQQFGQILLLTGGVLWGGSALVDAIKNPPPPKQLNGEFAKSIVKFM